jgi:signal transduction histidine kinase
MNRPLHIWSFFAVCACVLLGAMTWITTTALRLEKAHTEAQISADFEERVRLALWRMDSLLTPIIVEESARPADHYRASAKSVGPSPLRNQLPPHALLYFEIGSYGLISPQFSEPPVKNQSESIASQRLEQLRRLLAEPATYAQSFDNRLLLSNMVASAADSLPVSFTNTLLAGNQQVEQQVFNPNPAQVREQNQRAQVLRNSAEYQARASVYQQAALGNNQAALTSQNSSQAVAEGPMVPMWLGSALVLARRVNASDASTIQGVWLNWDGLKQTLKENVQDLFPEADWRMSTGTNGYSGRRLAALPVEFHPASIATGRSSAWSPTRVTLAFAWVCMLLALAAVAVLMNGAVSLSERRGAFVSAVTHELRTPLTTFKMYSEMLAAGMVTEEGKRRQYLDTLCAEANRLSHLVENVLAYARLERGSARSRIERMTLGELIERTSPRLRERAERADMKLLVDAEEAALATVVHVDAAAVEQILFNLVDNACKYATPKATEKLIHLEAFPDGKFAMLRVRDHGAGISAEGARRLFKPFSKSAQEAAHSAPGIGLGLALCRRLSRSLGGELRLVPGKVPGACFELRLPLGAPAA